MFIEYSDITSRITDPPLWWDQNGTPRYDPFEPWLVPSVYAQEAVLILIACQNCAREFRVGVHRDIAIRRLSDHILAGEPLYLDPPAHDSCLSGSTMLSRNIAVLEYWIKVAGSWERIPGLEIAFPTHEDD